MFLKESEREIEETAKECVPYFAVCVCLCVIRIVLESREKKFECNLIKPTDYACTKFCIVNSLDAVIKW